MKKTVLFLFATLASGYVVNGQVLLTPRVIASTGQYVHQGPMEISYTVGEMSAVSTIGSIGGLHLTQGFHQPEEAAILSALAEQKKDDINFALFPNPATQTIWIGYKMPRTGKINVCIYQITGQLIQTLFTGDYTGGSSLDHFDVSQLSSGNYLVSVQFTPASGDICASSKEFSVTH